MSPAGSDANLGTAQSPFRTITRAAVAAKSGDTVLVASGRYAETVNLNSRHSGVTFRGVGDSRPVIDGGGRRAYGFRNAGASGLTLSSFETTGQTEAGIYTQGTQNTVSGNLIHHIGSPAEPQSNGIRVVRGSANLVIGNTVHHIGPGLSSMGIWLVETRDARVEDNSVYLIRKEGIRDWKGLDNAIVGNRAFLSWVGISLNTSTGSIVTDNHVYDNVEGFAVKHASYETVLDYWDLDAPHWSRLQHNTAERSSETGIWIGQSDEPLDYVEVRDNLFAGAGAAFVRDIPSLRGPNVVVEANAYSNAGGRPRWLYKAGWSSAAGLTEWSSVRRQTGWERVPPPTDAGARAVRPASVVWTPFEMSPVDSSSKGTYYTRAHLDDTADDDQSTYWMTEGNRDEYVVFDFGQQRTFNHLLLTLYSNGDRRNPRAYRFAVSDDGRSWRTVLEGVNEDTSHAARFYELPQAVSGRYLRFTMVDTFCETYMPRVGCGENFVLSDLEAGLLGVRDPATTDTPPAPQPAEARVDVGRRALLTRAGELRLRVRCAGAPSGRTRFTVGRRRGSRRVALTPDCRRSVDVPLRRALAARIRRGGVRRLRVTVAQPHLQPVTSRVRVRVRA